MFKIKIKNKILQAQKTKKETSTVSVVITMTCLQGADTEVVKLVMLQGSLLGVMKTDFLCLTLGFVNNRYAHTNKYLLAIVVDSSTQTVQKLISVTSIVVNFIVNLHGNPLQRTSIGVDIFFSLILSYFCFFVAALRPCHGRLPRLKYMRT